MRPIYRYLTTALTIGLLSCPTLGYSSEKKYTKEEVVLFCSQTCPPCQKVLEYLRQIDRAVTIRNVSESEENLEALLRVGGKAKVPCLAVDHKTIYESSSIISWLSEHKDGLPSHRGHPIQEHHTAPQPSLPEKDEPKVESIQAESDKDRIKKIQDKHRTLLKEKMKLEEKAKEKEKKKK